MLTFLGRGSGFYPEEGNTSACVKENNEILLIDCGETVYTSLIKNKLLEGVDDVNVAITHTHSDHIGSLGSLVLYCFCDKHKPLNIVVDENVKHIENIRQILAAMGIEPFMFNFINSKELDGKFENFDSMRFRQTNHCKELNCCSIVFSTKEGVVYYSGDSNEFAPIQSIIESNTPINKIYVDVTNIDYLKRSHLDLDILNKVVPMDLRDKVYCMHFCDASCIKNAKDLGFQVVEPINQDCVYSKN